jgi:hypothetical protein
VGDTDPVGGGEGEGSLAGKIDGVGNRERLTLALFKNVSKGET